MVEFIVCLRIIILLIMNMISINIWRVIKFNLDNLTKSSSVPLKTPAPPEAKLTPLINAFGSSDLDFIMERYGTAVGNPSFAAAYQTKQHQHLIQINQIYNMDWRQKLYSIKVVPMKSAAFLPLLKRPVAFPVVKSTPLCGKLALARETLR